MKMPWRTVGSQLAAVSILLLASSWSPTAVAAQDMQVDSARMTRFVQAYIAVGAARDEFQGEVARIHDEEGRLRAREKVEAAIDAALADHDLTHDEYDQITLSISIDGDLRARFDSTLAELQGEPSGGK